MQLHDLDPQIKNQAKTRVGRGGSKGKTAGRGHKGQLARAGGTPRPQIRDRLKKIPKLRGYNHNPVSEKPVAVNLNALSAIVSEGDYVSPRFLVKKGLVQKEGDTIPAVKILGRGDIDVAVTVVGCTTSESAKEKVTAAGGEVN